MLTGLTDQAALRARFSGRSYWRLRYTDGSVVNEWDVDWSLAPLVGRQAVRLYCPDGKVAELGSTGVDCSGRLFQLKVGMLLAGVGRFPVAQIVGQVVADSGECRCAAWNYQTKSLSYFSDNFNAMQYENLGQLSAGVLGVAV